MLTRDVIKRGDSLGTSESKRVLPRGTHEVDAGCCFGATVSSLADAGIDGIGIEFAEDTVADIQKWVPELQIKLTDVRALRFGDGSLDGVWSLCAIEHFYDGFAPLITKSQRVLRPGGYLFVTAPAISPVKTLKAHMGRYPADTPEECGQSFQCTYRPGYIAEQIGNHGFSLVRRYGGSGAFGLIEEEPRVRDATARGCAFAARAGMVAAHRQIAHTIRSANAPFYISK